MRPCVRSALKWIALPLWVVVITGMWLMPVRVVVVLTGAAVSGTCAVVADDDGRISRNEARIAALFGIMDSVSETMGIKCRRRGDLSIVRRADDL